MENFVNDKFYEILVNRIKSEITLALTERNLLSVNSDDSILLSVNSNNAVKQDALITALNDEITFLRNEILSEDKIIELIIKERSVNNCAKYIKNTNDRNNLSLKDSLQSTEHIDNRDNLNKSCSNKYNEDKYDGDNIERE